MNEFLNLIRDDIGNFRLKEPLSKHSSWKIGGIADLLVEPHTVEQIKNIVDYSYSMKIPLVVIGNGTNFLFCDEGIRGIVMKLSTNFSNYKIEDTIVCAEAGIWVPKLANLLSDAGLSCMEHAIGIPGTLGGLVFMNGGSGGKCVGNIVKKIWIIDKKGNFKCLSQKECDFSYRKSSLQYSGSIIYKVELKCEHRDCAEIKAETNRILQKREEKFPVNLPNCGSVFLSTPSVNETVGAPGKLIEEAGLKGFQIGDARISEKHANFIVNMGKAKAEDIISLVQNIRKQIYGRYNLWLESEVKYVDEMGNIKSLHEVGNI